MLFKKNNQKENDGNGIIVIDNPTSIVSEQYRTIRTNIQFSMVDQALQTLLITSATPSSGKTTTTLNLAAAFASEGIKVLTVSTDLRKPRIGKMLGLTQDFGLTNILADRDLRLEDVIVQSTQMDSLHHLLSGPIPPNPAELLNSNRMSELIEEMKAQYDLVLFDTPPVLAVTDAQILASKVDGTIIVVPQGEVSKKELDEMHERLDNVKANVLGAVLNKVESEEDSYYYYYSDNE